jgi:hypothetical protein
MSVETAPAEIHYDNVKRREHVLVLGVDRMITSRHISIMTRESGDSPF